jgi:uncharacterized membrane protein
MVVGIIMVARMLPGYSHLRQTMSELGAKGRPTTNIHPFINNYPIGVLFSLFGISLYLNHRDSFIILISAILIFIHGISHVITGLFPCDENVMSKKPSRTQITHSVAGLVMLLTLFSASVLWALSASAEPVWFRWLSAACAVASLLFLVIMFKGVNIGLYQRLSYGALVLWAAIFSGLAYVRP